MISLTLVHFPFFVQPYKNYFTLDEPFTWLRGTGLEVIVRLPQETTLMKQELQFCAFKFSLLNFFFIFIFILLTCRKAMEALIHRVGNYPDLLPEIPRYCCPLAI